MKRKKAVIIASLISGISLMFSEASVSSVYATEKISEAAEGEESEMQGENESENHSESMTTEIEGSETQSQTECETHSECEMLEEAESGTQSESESEDKDKRTLEDREYNTDEMETVSEESESYYEQDTDTDISNESGQLEKRWKIGARLTSLQMPQKFEIMMDPWEIDGRTQVYSEQYVIKNTGKIKGTLKLTGIACEAGDGINVRVDSDGIHDGKDKNIFIELIINSEDRITLLPDGSDYEIELKTGEEITLEFTGQMNENASEAWQDSDVKITVVYDWNVEPEETEEENTDELIEEESEEETTVEVESSDIETEEESHLENSSEGSDVEDDSSFVQESNLAETDTEDQESSSANEASEQETQKTTEEVSDMEQTMEDNNPKETDGIDDKKEIQQEIPELEEETKNEQED